MGSRLDRDMPSERLRVRRQVRFESEGDEGSFEVWWWTGGNWAVVGGPGKYGRA